MISIQNWEKRAHLSVEQRNRCVCHTVCEIEGLWEQLWKTNCSVYFQKDILFKQDVFNNTKKNRLKFLFSTFF